jgi:hypothetical protein
VGWKAITRSVIGTSHKENNTPCQDYGAYKIFDNIIVGAVADGAGSAQYSHIGAKKAVDTIINSFQNIINSRFQDKNLNLELSQEIAKKVFIKITDNIIKELEKEADKHKYEIKDLACTLIAFIATPQWLAAMQIGDGFILIDTPSQKFRMLFKPDKGEFFNETTFITSTHALEEMQIEVVFDKIEFICVSTDGIEKVAIHLATWQPHPPFFSPLRQYLEETNNPEQEDSYIQNFLESEKLNARTDDDKTLMLCLQI